MKRKLSDEKTLKNKKECLANKSVRVEFALTDSEEETVQHDETFEPPHSHPSSSRKVLFNPSVCKVADKYQISHRALTEIVFADKVTDENSDQVTISVMTCKRQRDIVRSAAGCEIEQRITNSIESSDSLFLLQWDGKLLEDLTHVKKSVEHIAVILHSLMNPMNDKILSITGLNDKSSTAENEAKLIQENLQKYPTIHQKIIGFCFDTTAVNTGLRNGVVVRLQQHLEKRLLLLACRHICSSCVVVQHVEQYLEKQHLLLKKFSTY